MCVGIPTHVKYNALFNLVPILWYWLGALEMKDIYERLGICKIFVKYICKYRMHHPVFGNTHTCLDFSTHVWFLPNTSMCLRYLVKTTHVWEKPHTWEFRLSLKFPHMFGFSTHMEVLEIIGNSHTCEVPELRDGIALFRFLILDSRLKSRFMINLFCKCLSSYFWQNVIFLFYMQLQEGVGINYWIYQLK